ncbi:MAG: DEAD/DEAH box helicase, partial [Myxococcota bacterium]
MLFEDLGLDTVLLKNVADQGYTSSTPIQAKAIPPLLKGRDLLGLAQTGTGKTAAFALPVLQRLSKAPRPSRGRAPRALVLAPTRELVGQIADAFGVYGRGLGIRATIVFGGVNQNPQIQALRRGVDIVVATPGRLLDLLGQGHVSLDAVSLLVLDEADRMLDMGFIKPIRQIASRLPPKRQSLLFSATMPKAMRKLADELLVDPVEVSIAPKMVAAPRIEQSILHVDRKFKPDILRDMLSAPDVERAIVFTRTKHGADRLAKKLGRSSTEAVVIHGNKSQNARNRALDAFRSGKTRVLIATDVVARGIDVDQVSHVINFDLPNDPESYVHRIGRTGRAGATGTAVSLCDPSERDYLKSIEKLTKRAIPVR